MRGRGRGEGRPGGDGGRHLRELLARGEGLVALALAVDLLGSQRLVGRHRRRRRLLERHGRDGGAHTRLGLVRPRRGVEVEEVVEARREGAVQLARRRVRLGRRHRLGRASPKHLLLVLVRVLLAQP